MESFGKLTQEGSVGLVLAAQDFRNFPCRLGNTRAANAQGCWSRVSTGIRRSELCRVHLEDPGQRGPKVPDTSRVHKARPMSGPDKPL